MALQNDVAKMVDLPHAFQEVVNFAPANSAAWACVDDDGERYIYKLLSATSFWRYDTWKNTYQQLANPTGTFGAGTTIRYTKMVGTQLAWVQYGTIYALVTSGTGAATFQKYDIATNVWSTLNVTGFPATYGTDASLLFPTPLINAFDPAGYHSGVLRTITASANALVNATTISVSALPEALPIWARLNFWTLSSPIWATLTAAAAASAVSITVAPLVAQVNSAATAQWYGNLYIIGNANTQMYRFNLGTATWSTTSANSGNPAIPVMPSAPWAWNGLRWVPWIAGYENKLVAVRGANTANVYTYDLVSNTWATLTLYPTTELFTTWTSTWVIVNTTSNKPDRILLSASTFHNNNVRILEIDVAKQRIDPVTSLVLYPTGAAVVGDKMTIIKSPDWYQAIYQLLHTSNAFVRDFSISVL